MPNNEKNTNCKEKPLLLFSALDWGLGHLTRSIPLLLEFKEQGWDIVVACNSTQRATLQPEIPGIAFTGLPGYNIKYGRKKLTTKAKLALQVFKILTAIKKENHWLEHFLQKTRVNAILSDNRYGLWSEKVPSIFITHQLRPFTGLGSFMDNFVQKFLNRYINQFSECWVPDNKDGVMISGKLSHTQNKPLVPVKYIGPLSRLKEPVQERNKPTFLYDVLVIISGPEPQRTIFENRLLKDINTPEWTARSLKIMLVRGLPGKENKTFPDLPSLNHVTADELYKLAESSNYIVCRSGYTSLMDMLKLQKKMILVPTPGQTEQEYLAAHFMKNNIAPAMEQKNFSLHRAIELAHQFEYKIPGIKMDLYKQEISRLTRELFPDDLVS